MHNADQYNRLLNDITVRQHICNEDLYRGKINQCGLELERKEGFKKEANILDHDREKERSIQRIGKNIQETLKRLF